MLCVGNVVVCLQLPDVVERSNKLPGKRPKARGQGFCPFLRWLCLEEGITPLVWSKVAEAGTVSASFAIARSLLKAWGISISLRRVEREARRAESSVRQTSRLTYHFNQHGLSQRQSLLFHLQQETLAITPMSARPTGGYFR